MAVSSAPPSPSASDDEFVQSGMSVGESTSFRSFSVAEDGSTPTARLLPSAPSMDDVTPFDKASGDGAEEGAKVGVRRMKGTRKTWHFKMIVVGESGLGKTTAIECLTADLCASPPRDNANPRPARTSEQRGISAKTINIEEGEPFEIVSGNDNVIMLTIVDTPGYGDKVDCSSDMGSICDYIEKQWEKYRDADQGVPMEEHNSLVTCCLYFIAPHRLKKIDTAFLSRVSAKVPCIPVIAKSDTMTKEEARAFRAEVANTLAKHPEIKLYDWKYGDKKVVDESVAKYREKHEGQALPPFTIVANSSGKRIYEWGTCDLENENHSDFALLRRLVLEEHLYEMKKKAEESYKAWKRAGGTSAVTRLLNQMRKWSVRLWAPIALLIVVVFVSFFFHAAWSEKASLNEQLAAFREKSGELAQQLAAAERRVEESHEYCKALATEGETLKKDLAASKERNERGEADAQLTQGECRNAMLGLTRQSEVQEQLKKEHTTSQANLKQQHQAVVDKQNDKAEILRKQIKDLELRVGEKAGCWL